MSSNDWRRLGNEKYAKAGGCSSLVSAGDLLKEAVRYYESAFNTATNDEEKCFAKRNLGMTNWHLGRNCEKRATAAVREKQTGKCFLLLILRDGSTYHYDPSHHTVYCPSVMLHFYKEAMTAFSQCRQYISGYSRNNEAGGDRAAKRKTPAEFYDQLNGNMNECSMEALKFLKNMDYFSTYNKRIDQLQYLITACGDRYSDLSVVFHLEKAKTYHKWAITEMERSKNYKTALNCLHECYSPLETIRSLCANKVALDSSTVKHQNEANDLFDSIKIDAGVAEAMRLMDKADTLLRSAIFDEESINMDDIYDALFDYRSALVTLRDDEDSTEMLLEAEVLAKMGRIYYDLLKNEVRAKEYCLEAIQLANFTLHQNLAGKEWFDKASEILKHIQDEKLRKEEEALRKDREPFLKELEKELDDLKKLSEKSAEHLLKELIKKFEPKHKAGTKALEELSKGEFTHKTPRDEIKKALSKLILLYHPDHVDVKVHGAKYHVLCDEITKVITGKYECFKG